MFIYQVFQSTIAVFFCIFFVVSVVADKPPENINNSSSYQLPRTISPESYDVLILPKVTEGDTFYKGEVILTFNVINETKKIVLHSDGLRIQHKKSVLQKVMDNSNLMPVRINDQIHDNETQFFTVDASRNLDKGKYLLSLYFEGAVLDGVVGFYRTYYILDNRKRWIGATQFSPTFARRAFPCMDEPGFKATFQIAIGHFGNETVSSNTLPKGKNTTSIRNYYITTFARTPRMSTYLVAWAVHDFTRIQSKENPRFSLWTRRSNTISPQSTPTNPILEDIPKIYSALQNWTGIDVPINKFELLALPDFLFGAMENWGLVTCRESMILISHSEMSIATIRSRIIAMAHEYAHTWFGNLMTMDFWNFAWLKEGFATYMSNLAVGMVHKDWRVMDLFSVSVMQPSLASDSVNYNRTLNGKKVGSPASIMKVIDLLIYNKGASIVRMMSDIVGERNFQNAMQSLLNDKKFQSITPSDLYSYLEGSIPTKIRSHKIPTSIGKIVESWANQPNFPLVQVSRESRREINRKLKISQVAFQLSENQQNISDGRAWWVPISIAVAQGTKNNLTEFSTWLTPRRPEMMDLPPDATWYLLNPRQIGYYRVKYDAENWQALIRILDSEKYQMIPTVARAGLIDDVFNLARAGYETYSLALDLIKYLPRETEYGPWTAACRAFQFIYRKLGGQPHVQTKFRSYALQLMSKTYKKFQFMEPPTDSHVDKLHRTLILFTACILNSEHCVSRSKEIFQNWASNKSRTVPANFRNAVYTTAISHGDYHNWLFLWNAFLKTDSHAEMEAIMEALGQTKNSSLIKK
ncbi:hypothetical protein QAD02_018037 [Eretmocerus hayati]|uniref:Uncharacterized protein n=1 Tax=Eretmocerus hayati TaxID=131215 RepID=A0ACC2PKE0_9HYME|nr:hypothetical protein QAD02_018037 [Eretmocerus hayati]